MRVCIVPEYPSTLMTGGMQVQAEETCQALASVGNGVTAELFNWSHRGTLPDLYHFVSLQPFCYPVVDLVHAAGRPYVITLLGGIPRGQERRLWLGRVRFLIKTYLLGKPERHRVLKRAGMIITINRLEATAVQRIYGVDEKRIRILSHGIHERFFDCSSVTWRAAFGEDPFLLCVGGIQPRKNQLRLVEAGNRLRLPVVLLGPELPEEKDYARSVATAMKQNAAFGGRWLQTLQNDNALLQSAYGACRLFVLLSSCETQPLSALQAMAAGKPVLLLRAPYTGEPPFHDLPQVDSLSPAVLDKALQNYWNNPRPTTLSRDFTWSHLIGHLKAIYEQVLQQHQPAN